MADQPIERVVFLGYSSIVAETVRQATELGVEFLIITDRQQAARELGPGLTFEAVTSREGVVGVVHDDIGHASISEALGDMKSSIAISVGAPWFFSEGFLSHSLQNRALNLHGTRLPKDRGGAIFSWMIMRGQRTGLCLLHRMSQRIDAGEVIRYEEFIYSPHIRKPGQMMAEYDQRNVEFLLRFVSSVAVEGLDLADQQVIPDYLSSYWPRLDARINGWIDWRLEAAHLERFVCAFDEPYGGARSRLGETEVVLRDVYSQAADGATHPFQWGIVFRKNKDWLTVAVNGGELLVCSLTDTDGNDVASSIKVGDRLMTPQADLERGLARPSRAQQVNPSALTQN